MSKVKDVRLDGNKSLPVKEFKLDSMCENPAIVMIAKRGSGKSYIVREILEYYHDIPVGAIICPTEAENPYYSKNKKYTFILQILERGWTERTGPIYKKKYIFIIYLY